MLAKEPLRGGKEKEVLKVKNDLMDSSVEDNNYLEKFEYHKVILIIIITFDWYIILWLYDIHNKKNITNISSNNE